MFDLLEELKGLVAALDGRGIPYALCGGLAMAVHGAPRATEDIDLLIRPEALSAVLDVARERGFEFEAAPMSFKGGAVEIRRITRLSAEDALMLDLLLVTPGIEEVWASRTRMRWAYGTIWSVSRDGLRTLKALSGRIKDLLDLELLKEVEGNEPRGHVA